METAPGKALRERALRRLQERRRELLAAFRDVERRLEELEAFERGEPEREERAQEDQLADVLGRLEDREQLELREILHALARIRDGGWGTCERCGAAIPRERLEALPATRFCRACAEAAEREPASEPPVTAPTTTPPAAPDYEAMTDDDLRAAVLEHFRDAGAGFEGVDAVVERGRIRLEGYVPTGEHRELAVDLVADRMGLEAAQALRVEPLAFPSSGREADAGLPRDEPQVRAALGEESDESEDVLEAEENGLGYSPPDRPVRPPRKE
jgi:RNA polymerase-binding transcription factor DksA